MLALGPSQGGGGGHDPSSAGEPAPRARRSPDFVERVRGENGVPVEERVAVFDDDGMLWCRKPMSIQIDFIVRRVAEMAEGAIGLNG